uniref:Uncharacterized protein n=1 Tax=Physcomitrium patens TaxID=3218 RepID=A0A2K1L8C6_PHYPA|nr:hypothetical protein PHYPA_000707 [Physcomitrium patens]
MVVSGDDAQNCKIVQAEMQRLKRFPSGSSYATNRFRMLDKALQLLGKVCGNVIV